MASALHADACACSVETNPPETVVWCGLCTCDW